MDKETSEQLRDYDVHFNEKNAVQLTDTGGVPLLPSIEEMDLTITHLKFLKGKGQDYIDKHNKKLLIKLGCWRFPNSARKKISKSISGFIYFVEKDGYVKIGRSKDPTKRIEAFTSNHPTDNKKVKLLHIIESYDIVRHEKEFHNIFASKRISGEWFELSDEDIRIIKEFKEV